MNSSIVTDISSVTDALRSGAVVAYPTEAVFGFGCDPSNPVAVTAIHSLKCRNQAQGFLLVASNLSQVKSFVDMSKLDESMLSRVLSTWPGPVTWVFPASASAPQWVMGQHDGIAIRISAHASVSQLCEAFGGAIVSTSANPHGLPAAINAQEVLNYFPRGVAAIWDRPVGQLARPTPIYDALSGRTIRA